MKSCANHFPGATPVQSALRTEAKRPFAPGGGVCVRHSSTPTARGHVTRPSSAAKEAATRPVTVVLADDHPLACRGMRELIETEPGFRVVGEAADGAEALRLVEKLKPEIAVLDISMPELNGLDVARKLRRTAPDVKVIILTMHFAQEVALECLHAGARAFVLKSDTGEDLLEAMRTVRDGQLYFTPRILDFLNLDGAPSPGEAAPQEGSAMLLERLTPREVEVTKLLCAGMSSRQIASQIAASTRTVECHRRSIQRKLHTKSLSELVRLAIRAGISPR
jgi:two-component system, NarL family, nitrate/nitrite response regulator NarL